MSAVVEMSAEELHARLSLRAMWSPVGGAKAESVDDHHHEPGPSAFHKKFMKEIDDVLNVSLKRRLERVQKNVAPFGDAAADAAHTNGVDTNGHSQEDKENVECVEVQTVVTCASASSSTAALEKAMGNAFKKAFVSSRPKKFHVYGASRMQLRFNDPPEKKEEPDRETVTLRQSMQCLKPNLGNRERQIKNLSGQLDTAKEYREKSVAAEAEAMQRYEDHAKDKSLLPKAHSERLIQRRNKVAELRKAASLQESQVTYYRKVVFEQRAFYVQSDCISVNGGNQMLNRHPAGDLYVAPKPDCMGDEEAEKWDVGTAVANPYVCDSWPFEANVLARRCAKEPEVEGLEEETEEDLIEANRPPSARKGGGLEFRLPFERLQRDSVEDSGDDDADDSGDDGDPGAPATARSL